MIILLIWIPLVVRAQGDFQVQEVQQMKTLFDSLSTHPQTKQDEIMMEKALLGKRIANGMLYPKVNAFGKYEYASTASGMLPLAPNDLFAMIKDQNIPQPFSQNIFRIGAGVSMPVFALSIYTTAAKAAMLYRSAEAQAYINLQKNEAILVSSNANLQYLSALLHSLDMKKASLSKTLELIEMQVENGRVPKTAMLKIKSALNEINILENNILQKREGALSVIRSLTGITLKEPVDMVQRGTYQNGNFRVLDPLKNKIEADRLAWRAEKEKLAPSLFLNGNYNHSFAKAYNNDKSIDEGYGVVGLTLNIPVFAKSQYARIKQSRLQYESSQNELKKMVLELNSEASALESNLPLLNQSIELYKQSIKDKKELWEVAKVSYLSHRMTVEDYLKYENDVVLEESNLYKTRAHKWQTLMQLAVIYGNKIEQIVE